MKAKRTSKISIRTRPDILEAADNLKATNGYSRADIFEMGVLLLESNNDSALVLQNKIYSEMVDRFEDLSEKVHKECENIQNHVNNKTEIVDYFCYHFFLKKIIDFVNC